MTASKRKVIVLIILFCAAFLAEATPVRFYSVNSLYGISMREMNSVCEDANGFVWASSKSGILRINKDNYHIYQLPYESADVVKVRLAYRNAKLYAYTNNGQVFLYNSISDQFELVVNLKKFISDANLLMFDMLIDEKGACWMSTSLGLYNYQAGKLKPVFAFTSHRCAISWYDSRQIILAKQDGIWLFDSYTLQKKQQFESNHLHQFNIFSLYLEKDKTNLWLGTLSEGLLLYNFKKGTLENVLGSVLPKQPILAIEENTDTTCLIGFDGQGIWELDRRKKTVLNIYKENVDIPSSLKGNGVYDLFCDDNKRVWVCTYSGGLSFFDQASPLVNQIVHLTNNPNSLVNNDVNSIIEDRWGKLWFATNNGIGCWDVSSDKWKSYYNSKETQARVFLSLCEDNQGRIWAGNYSSGVYVLDSRTGNELAHYKNEKGSPMTNDFVTNIMKDSQGDIWLGGGTGHFYCYLAKENRFRVYSEEPIGRFVEMPDNRMLLGCSYGLSELNKETGEVTRLLEGLLIRDAQVVANDIWICTSGDGLVKYNYRTGATEKFTSRTGLPSNFVNSVMYAGDYLWIGTERGLCRFNPKDESVLNYSSIYSLSQTSFNPCSHFRLKNGQLAWGTNNGAVIFAPTLVNETPVREKIYFQDISVAGRSIRNIPGFNLKTPIDSLTEINLKYYQNNIRIEVLSLGEALGSKFSWKMEGFDQQWTQPSENSMITYTNIPSGHFVLKIKLLDSSLSRVLNERTITINSIPPFWRKGWFIILLFLFVSGIAVLYFLFYINRLKQKHAEEKVRFFTNTAHDIRTSLTLIKAPVQELNREENLSPSGRRYLQLAVDQTRQLSSVVTQLMDFQKVDIGKEQLSLKMVDIVQFVSLRKAMYEFLAESRNIKLIFTSDRESYITAVDELKIEKVIDNLISNAVKYSHDNSQVMIELKCYDNRWTFQVKDRGIGISRKSQRHLFKEFYRSENAINAKIVGSGIGLLLVKKYVDLHNGTINFDSQENVGTTFRITVPYREIAVKGDDSNVLSGLNEKPLSTAEPNQALPDQEAQVSKKLKVLVVEDNEDLLDFLGSTLSAEFKVFKAEDGIEAWTFISRQMPDLVISDIMMPNMNGYELCKLMKSTYETSHIPIILLTALSGKSEQLQGLGLGADDYLTKPFDVSLLMQRIKTIIRNREAVRERALKVIKGNTSEPVLANDLNDKFVKKITEVARANISNSEFNKDMFASEMNMSPSLLYKKIKSLTDQSPTDFIKVVRLDHALELLTTGRYTVTEVSELCGFASVAYFSTVFKKHFGKSPTEIRE